MAGPAGATRLPIAEREAINRTLDRFVDSAVKRHDVAASWNLVTPEMRAGVSRSAWDKGNLPVIPYSAGGTTFHDWTIDSASATEVDFELMIPSEKSKSDSIQFNGTMRKQHGRWLVDSFNPSATFGGGAVVSGSDYAPPPGGGGTGEATLGSVWIVIPTALIGAGILFLIGWFLFGWVRGRSRREHLRPLDPLIRKRESEPALVAEERSQADG